VKIALAQLNTVVGDCRGNLAGVLSALGRARDEGADLVVFPEQTLPGYPAEDLLEREDFVDEVEAAFEEAVAACEGIAMVLGTVVRTGNPEGKPIYNSAALVKDREVLGFQHKTLLPTYDVFDEARYFCPATEHPVFELGGRKLALAICEDLWNLPGFCGENRYDIDPLEKWTADGGADLVVAISASPFSLGRPRFRRGLLEEIVKARGVDLIYCNLVGGNTSLVFDGSSLAMDSSLELLCGARSFQEDLAVFELPPATGNREPAGPAPVRTAEGEPGEEDLEQAFGALVLGTRDYLHKSGFKKAVLGLSGGIDSALTAAVAAEALGPENLVGVTMPSRYSSEGSVSDSVALAGNLGITLEEIPIEKIFSSALDTLAPVFEGLEEDVTEENLQARIRGLLLMALSNKLDALLLTTGNKSELAVGYCTLYGDMSGGLAVISDVPKTLVYRIAEWLNRDGEIIPPAIIEKPPSAELRPDQKDTDSLPAYDVLDGILEAYIEEGQGLGDIIESGFEEETAARILGLVDRNEYKRLQAAPGLRITSKAFGPGRRFPVVKRLTRIEKADAGPES
jgi:NAD+ synthetase